jgi:RNA polymerase sigma-70 factor, ECF subfamily
MFGKKRSEKDEAYQREAIPHLDALYGTALRMTKDEQDAEDLVQEAMLKAYRYFDKYENGTNCKAWLFKIMTNTFINRYRKSKKRKEYLVDDDYRPLQERAEAPEQNPFVDDFNEDEENLYFKMFGDEVKEALEAIPVDFRMVVLLADLQDFAYKEIAEIMDCPIGTVMSRLYRGRRMLQAKLEGYAVEEGYISVTEDEAEQQEAEADSKTADLDEYRRRRAEG